MRVLLIHPEDELQDGPWASEKWDRVIDLGLAGAQSYARAAASFGCPVTPLDSFRENFKEMRKIRELLALGWGRLEDRFGLDWWELTSIRVHDQLERTILLGEFVDTLGSLDEVYVSRPGFHADTLRLRLKERLHTFHWKGERYTRGPRHYLRVLKKFPARQLVEIFWDKTDPGYQIRGVFGGRPKPSSGSVVLLPTAYVNVSRVGFAYANCLPEVRFLMVATRPSGWIQDVPPNVSLAWLRRYASVRVPSRKLEYADLIERWKLLRRELKAVPEFATLDDLGSFNGFPGWFAEGLEIRDAWRNVLDREPVESLICGDDSNPHTHIPLLLAKHRGLPTISCHHGALDGRYMFKRTHADVILAKGKMEQDYLLRVCGLPEDRVEIGAPARVPDGEREEIHEKKPYIVLFSELYEVGGGRGKDFYQDMLPLLADLALSEGRELIVKLHPAESLAERSRIVAGILKPEQMRVTRVVSGALQPDLLSKTWFGVTVLSTVSMECALRGIPCFLCGWLESWPYGYVEEFTRFGAGIRLNAPEEISQIPKTLKDYKPSGVQQNCWTSIEAGRFQALLGIKAERRMVVAK